MTYDFNSCSLRNLNMAIAKEIQQSNNNTIVRYNSIILHAFRYNFFDVTLLYYALFPLFPLSLSCFFFPLPFIFCKPIQVAKRF